MMSAKELARLAVIKGAIDGVWYHSSGKIHCGRCLRVTKDGVTAYYHSMAAGSIVKPGDKAAALPVMGEMIRNEDGAKKRDCGRNAAKRRLKAHSVEYGWLKPALLGDDLYANYPLCRDILDSGISFIRKVWFKTPQLAARRLIKSPGFSNSQNIGAY